MTEPPEPTGPNPFMPEPGWIQPLGIVAALRRWWKRVHR